MAAIPLRRVFWRLARYLGRRGREWSWNNQYAARFWQSDTSGRSEAVLQLVHRLARGGRLIEFGCGEGSLPSLLAPGAFSSYQGIDISKVAIHRAVTRTKEQGIANCAFEATDMTLWSGDRDVSLIVMEECLYYLSSSNQEQLLQRCLESLTADGRLLVIVHSADRHARTLETCRKVCAVEEEQALGARRYLVLKVWDT